MKTGVKISLILFVSLIGLVVGPINAQDSGNKKLVADDIFPADRVLDIQITVDPKDWDTIRFQSRDFAEALNEKRQYEPIDPPYTYVEAHVSIDGVEFPRVGIRKKGFIGSQNSTRPSLKIKLNHLDKKGQIDGLTNLTFNNNQQDVSLVSQFLGYALFNAAGSPAPRCSYANLTVNGQNLGIYAHVERIQKPLLQWAFGNKDGILYEGTVVDFHPDWAGSFELKFGSDKVGRKKIQQLIDILDSPDEDIELAIGELVDLESFYTFWAMEGLISFWDGYSGNRNNFFIYLNPGNNKFHFIPWGADSLFEGFGPFRQGMGDPVSVKIQGLIANRLYQLESGRRRYEQTLRRIIDQHWDAEFLLAETERIESLVTPYLTPQSVEEVVREAEEEAKGWINWLRSNPAAAREEALNSEDFRRLPAEAQRAIIEAVEQIETEEREGDENQKTGQFITDWSLLGPFYTQKSHDLDQDFLLEQGGEANIRPDQEQEFRNSKDQKLKWRSISDRKKIINLIEEIGRLDNVTAYAFCQIEGSGKEYVEFGLGSDDSAKVWINGMVVYQYREGRSVMIDQDRFTVKLNPGSNTCLVKVSQGMGDWGFVIRPVDRFPLSEGVMLSGQLTLKGKNRKKLSSIRLEAVIDSGESILSQDWGWLSNGDNYQRIVRVNKDTKLRLQAMIKGAVLVEQNIDLEPGQNTVVDLMVDTESSTVLKVLKKGATQSANRFVRSLEERRRFIRQRRGEIMAEIANGMPKWGIPPAQPAIMRSEGFDFRPPDSSIWSAAAEGDLKTVKGHLAKGTDNINTKDGQFGLTALSWATGANHVDTVSFLIQQGSNVNAKNRDGGTPLHTAAFFGLDELGTLLIENGADINARNNQGATVMDTLMLDWKTTEFFAGMMKLELDREMVETGRGKLVELLRQRGVDTGVSDPGSSSDIWTVAGTGNIEAVKQHLSKGVEVDAKNKDGATALHVAAILGHDEIAEFLIQKGANVDAKGGDGGTALHAAAFLGRSKVAKLLIGYGADIEAKNDQGATAMDSLKVDWRTTQFIVQLLQIRVDRPAVEQGRTKVAELLRQ